MASPPPLFVCGGPRCVSRMFPEPDLQTLEHCSRRAREACIQRELQRLRHLVSCAIFVIILLLEVLERWSTATATLCERPGHHGQAAA
jgi:hypothetical protein